MIMEGRLWWNGALHPHNPQLNTHRGTYRQEPLIVLCTVGVRDGCFLGKSKLRRSAHRPIKHIQQKATGTWTGQTHPAKHTDAHGKHNHNCAVQDKRTSDGGLD